MHIIFNQFDQSINLKIHGSIYFTDSIATMNQNLKHLWVDESCPSHVVLKAKLKVLLAKNVLAT